MLEKKLNKKLIIIVSVIAAVALIATVAVIVMLSQRETVADVLDLGDRYMSELDYESAIREYKRAIEIDPRSEDAYLKLAEAYIAIGDIDSAIEALEDGYAATNSERILARLNELRGGAAGGAHSPEDAESIVMASTPQKTTYNVGDVLDLTGLTLTVTYSDGATEVVSDGYTCEVETLDEAGTQEVTVRYGGAETTVTVTVVDGTGTEPAETEPPVTEPVETEPPFSVEDLPIAEDFAWTLEDGVLTISGHGRMPDYDFHEAPWFEKSDEIERVVINDGILSIGNNAFADFRSLTSITIPNSIMSIGNDAFCQCYIMTQINIPDSVISFGEGVFFNCDSLTSINIPDSTTSIGDDAFSGCSNLNSITVSDNNPNYCSIDGVLFTNDMTTLLSYPAGLSGQYVIPNSVVGIHDRAFYCCSNLTSITIPESVTSIGRQAFYGCDISSVILPGSVSTIGEEAFDYCYYLESITIPNSVIIIGNGAFMNCANLTSVNIPDSVEYIGNSVFTACESLTAITVSENNAYYCSVGGVLFSKDMTTLISCPPGSVTGHYDIPNGVNIVSYDAFFRCFYLTSVIIPQSVTSIERTAFCDCNNLTSVTILDNVVSIGDQAFFFCPNLTSITIPSSVVNIGEQAFDSCPNLTIHAPAGSTAESYARDNGIPFETIG